MVDIISSPISRYHSLEKSEYSFKVENDLKNSKGVFLNLALDMTKT